MKSGRLYIEDRIEGELQSVRFALPLAPGLLPELRRKSAAKCESVQERVELWVDLEDGFRLCVQLPERVQWRIESMACFERFGSRRERACLVGSSDDFRSGTWRFSVLSGNRSQASSRSHRGRAGRRRA